LSWQTALLQDSELPPSSVKGAEYQSQEQAEGSPWTISVNVKALKAESEPLKPSYAALSELKEFLIHPEATSFASLTVCP
jgi:hypothetical protein